jgi:hypothetical protein
VDFLIASARRTIRSRWQLRSDQFLLEIILVRRLLRAPYASGRTVIEWLASAALLSEFRAVRMSLLLHPFMDDHNRGSLFDARNKRRRMLRGLIIRLTAAGLGVLLLAVVFTRMSGAISLVAAGLTALVCVPAYTKLRYYNSWVSSGVGSIVETIKATVANNSRASKLVTELIVSEQPFALLLRSYDLEVTHFRTDAAVADPILKSLVDGGDRRISTRFMSSADESSEDRLSAALTGHVYPVRFHDLTDAFAGSRRDDRPRMCLPSNIWKDAIRDLIQVAPLIVVHVISLTPGVLFELETIVALGKQDSTVVVLCDPPERHAEAKKLTALYGVTTYDYPAVDPAGDVFRSFPTVVREQDIDYANLAEDAAFSGWITRAP